jgi:SAM-dependent methyltransferase
VGFDIEEFMNTYNAIDLLFGGMEKLGPGGNAHTLYVLRLLPKQPCGVIVDAGCGTGRQTMVLAKELDALVHAVDAYEPFLHDLTQRARQAGVAHLVHTHCMDMQDIPAVFPSIDLLWSEGAAYNIGFANALSRWACAITPGGFAVVSELSWLRQQVPDAVHTLPTDAWVEGYYDRLEPRAKALRDHPDASVRAVAVETVKEIEIFHASEESYGYVFYVLQRPEHRV